MGRNLFNRDFYQTTYSFWQRLKNLFKSTFLSSIVFLSLFMVSCLPATGNGSKVTVEELDQPSSFYPHQTGITWEYLPDGSSLDTQRVIRRVQGPKVLGGERYIVTSILGLGLNLLSYKQYRASGVFLSREEGPGYELNLNPPIKELPAQDDLRVGASWQGRSSAEIYFTEAPPHKNRINFTTEYAYTVVDKRTVRLNVGEFNVYVINLESRKLGEEGEILETLRSEIWFSPYIGEVRNQYDLVLVGGNFTQK